MKIEAFDIRFDSEDGVFTAGQNVTGTVILRLSKPTRIASKFKLDPIQNSTHSQ